MTATDISPATVEVLTGAIGRLALSERSLGTYLTYRIGGPAALLVEVQNELDLLEVHRALIDADEPVPVLVVGKGSNMLVSDDGFGGLVILLGRGLDTVDISGTSVSAGGSTSLPVLARRCVAAGLTGLEWAVGVPGSVGGAVRMNAGGHGAEIAKVLVSCRTVDLLIGIVTDNPVSALGYSYRHSLLATSQVVTQAEFALSAGDRSRSEEELASIVRWRRANQPGGSNSGSVFVNPPGDSAGRLIDAAGLKGYRIGTATVSDKHANFIQADVGGSARDVHALLVHVRDVVQHQFGVTLVPEVRLVGFPDSPTPLIVGGN